MWGGWTVSFKSMLKLEMSVPKSYGIFGLEYFEGEERKIPEEDWT